VQHLGRRHGNAYVQRYLASPPGAVVQRDGPAKVDKPAPQAQPTAENKVAFVREEGLNLRAAPDQHSASLKKMKFGQRVYTVEDSNPQPSWVKIVVLGQTGYAFAPRIHFPSETLIQRDPALRLIKVRSGLSFWALVKEMYGIEGNESTKDQNMNHFINAIRAFNKDEAFNVKTDMLDDIGNFFLSGRDAKNTYLKANYDLWIPSFGVAAKMDVGSGTIRGEITRVIKKIEQKIDDFKDACRMSVAYMPEAIGRRAGEMGAGLLHGLLDFAKDAVKILAISTAVGAVIGALFGGVGAIPGAEIGFEIGLLILEYYGLATLIEAVLNIAVDLVGQLGKFIGLVWDANGDRKQLDLAARALAEAIGILVSAVMVAVAAYLLKKGGEALGKTKFAQTVGETRLAQWFKERQQLKTTTEVKDKPRVKPPKAKDLGTEGGKKVLAEEPTVDGKHNVKVTDKGALVCSPSCPVLIQEIDVALKDNPGLKEKLDPLRKELEKAHGDLETARRRQDGATTREEITDAATAVDRAAEVEAQVAAKVKPQLDQIIRESPLPSGLRFNEYETVEAAIGMHEGKATLLSESPITNPKLLENGYTRRRYYRDAKGTKWSVDVRKVGKKEVYKAKESSGQDID
jgi:hypothetical protein